MDPKAKSALDKALQEKVRGNHDKALKKLQEAIRKFPSEPELYIEALAATISGRLGHRIHGAGDRRSRVAAVCRHHRSDTQLQRRLSER